MSFSSHQAAQPPGIVGCALATAEAQVDAWSTPNPAACVWVWRLRAAFDAEMLLASELLELNAKLSAIFCSSAINSIPTKPTPNEFEM